MSNPPPIPITVLIVDDATDVAGVVAWHAADLGFVTRVAGTVADARREIAADRFAVAVVDWRLADGSGADVLGVLAERSPETFRIVYSAHAEAETEATAVAAHDVVDKGQSSAALRHALRRGERFARGLARTVAPVAPPVGWSAAVTALFTADPPGRSLFVVPDVGRVPGDLLRYAAALGGEAFPVRVDLLASPPPAADWLFGTTAFRGALDHPAGVTLLARDPHQWPQLTQAALADALARQVIRRGGSDRDIPTRLRLLVAFDRADAVSRLVPELRAAVPAPVVRVPGVTSGENPAESATAAIGRLTGGRLGLTRDALELIRVFGLPWNQAELEHAVRSCPPDLTEASLARLGAPAFEVGVEADPPLDLRTARAAVERFYIHALTRLADGNVSRAAELAGMSRQAVYRFLQS